MIAMLAEVLPFSGNVNAALISAFFGSGISTLVMFILHRIVALRTRSKTEAEEFEEAIKSDNLSVLGGYLRNSLGSVTLGAYLGDGTASARVNRYLRRLEEFVQPPPDTAPEGELDSPPELGLQEDTEFKDFPDDPPAIADAVDRLRHGEIWTGLAGLRRDLERKLATDDPAARRRGPIYKDISDPQVREMTRRFWYIASRAVHGDEVSPDEAALAVNLAREVYHYLGRPKIVPISS